MKNVLLISLMLLLGSNCKKEKTSGPTTISGKVLDATDNRPVPGARVFLTSKNKDCSSALCYKTEASTTSAEDGSFSFDFNMDENKRYTLFGEAEHYFNDYTGADIDKAGKQIKNVLLEPKGYIGFRFVDEPPLGKISRISISLLPNSISGSELNSDTTVYAATKGNKMTEVIWTIRNGNDNEQFSRNIFFKSLDTTEFIIKY